MDRILDKIVYYLITISTLIICFVAALLLYDNFRICMNIFIGFLILMSIGGIVYETGNYLFKILRKKN